MAFSEAKAAFSGPTYIKASQKYSRAEKNVSKCWIAF